MTDQSPKRCIYYRGGCIHRRSHCAGFDEGRCLFGGFPGRHGRSGYVSENELAIGPLWEKRLHGFAFRMQRKPCTVIDVYTADGADSRYCLTHDCVFPAGEIRIDRCPKAMRAEREDAQRVAGRRVF